MLGNHFLLLKILYAISNMPKLTVASNVSRARVSKSVIEHPKVYSCKQYYSPAVAISAGLWYNINEESAVWQTVSTFPISQLQKMTARVQTGGHFLLLKILYAISKYHSPAVAISAGLWYNTDKESAVWQTVSTFPASQSQRMTAQA